MIKPSMLLLRNKYKFEIVSYPREKRFNIIWAYLVLTTVVSFILSYISEKLLIFRYPLINISLGYVLIGIWLFLTYLIWKKYFKQRKKIKKLDFYRNNLFYFLKANRLFETEMQEEKDFEGKMKKVEVVTNSVNFGFLDEMDTFTIRAYKRADSFKIKKSLTWDFFIANISYYFANIWNQT